MKASESIAFVAITKDGLSLARKSRHRLKKGGIFFLESLDQTKNNFEKIFPKPLSSLIPTLFQDYQQIVFFLSAGAIIRLITPYLQTKQNDPGVLCIDPEANFVIPLLSGHQGGSNQFARKLAACLGATPVVTTASDVLGGFSPDVLEMETDWQALPKKNLKVAASALANHKNLTIIQEIGKRIFDISARNLPPHVRVFDTDEKLKETSSDFTLRVSDRESIDLEKTLWYRPKSLVLGVGCEKGISKEALSDGLEKFLSKEGYCRECIEAIASIDIKAAEEGMNEWAEKEGWERIYFSANELKEVSLIPNPSKEVQRCVGTPGVAEPAALLASKSKKLLAEKFIFQSSQANQKMTFSLARKAEYEPPLAGHVFFIGAGPGDPELLTYRAGRVIQKADVIIYAGSLVPEEILRNAKANASLHNSAHLTLEETMEIMLRAVREGKTAVRIQSGDLSIYSAIQEQMEELDKEKIEYTLIPGISSFQAAAAKLKSELTIPEDVQTIILTRSEGKTQMPEGEKLEKLAAIRGSLCIFLSAMMAKKVQEKLLTAYPPETPTAILYRVSWPDEKIFITTLSHLSETIKENKLTRTTLIIVGKAIGARKNRSKLYLPSHQHIFRTKDN